LRGRDDGRSSAIFGNELAPVACGVAGVLNLGGDGSGAALAQNLHFGGDGVSVEASIASGVTDFVGVEATGHIGVVNVVNNAQIDVVDGAVMEEFTSVPVATVVAAADVAEAVIDPTVVANMRGPVAAMKAVAAVGEIPIGRGPQVIYQRGDHPGAGNPVIAGSGVVPVAGGPVIVVTGGRRLIVGGEWRGRLFGVDGRFAIDIVLETTGVGIYGVAGVGPVGWIGRQLLCDFGAVGGGLAYRCEVAIESWRRGLRGLRLRGLGDRFVTGNGAEGDAHRETEETCS
jgi:hypothetical protein